MGHCLRRVWVLLLFLCVFSLQAVPAVRMEDIPHVMERFFTFHIESKELNIQIVKRSFKLYLENFDPEKVYLADAEIRSYVNMSDRTAKEILARLQKHDYSDFAALNGLVQESIVRAQATRVFLAREIAHSTAELTPLYTSLPIDYAKSQQELMERQKNRLLRFYHFHQARTRLDTSERRSKVCALFERKVRRMENNYLFLTEEDAPMNQERVNHLLAVRILKSLAKSLDTHTSFFSHEEALEMRMSLEKHFEGVGVVLSEGIDGVMISELIKGSPAEQSGQIQVNDLLVEIDGIPVSNRSFEEVLDMLKKKGKHEIILGFKRGDVTSHNFFRVPLLKQAINMKEERIQVGYEQVEGGIIGKIALRSFYEGSHGISSERDIKEAIQMFREKGNLVGLVLDLRENSGGFLSQAVKVAGLFLSNGVVVISKYGKGEIHYLRNIATKSFYNGPLVVLTSKMSASASEIVAQTLQDYGVALVVGDERTFGKGSIQYQNVTDSKADLFFKVTVGRYYTPSGRSTQIDGVIADIVVPSHYSPYKIGERYLEYPLSPDQVEPAFVDPLTDLDEKTRQLFQMRYMPFAQRVIGFWKKMLPTLKANSARRLAADPAFQSFLRKQENLLGRANSLPPNTIDDSSYLGKEDLQMKEAFHIVEDMISLESQAELPHTGSD